MLHAKQIHVPLAAFGPERPAVAEKRSDCDQDKVDRCNSVKIREEVRKTLIRSKWTEAPFAVEPERHAERGTDYSERD